MEDLLACRVCLATDVKLFNMYQNKLIHSYENLIGTQVSADGLPPLMCSMCAALLMKSVTFKKKCEKAQQLFQYVSSSQQHSAISFIMSIDRTSHLLAHPYATVSCVNIDYTNDGIIKDDVKEELDSDDHEYTENTNDEIDPPMKFENESDEEPLSKKAKKKRTKSSIKIGNINKVLNENEDNVLNETDVLNESNVNETADVELDDIQIIFLSKEQQIEEIVLRKNSFNYLNSFYKCDKCYKGFITDSTFRNHMARHALSSGSHVCDICQTRWPNSRTLRAHVVTSHEKKYVCKRCNHVSKSSHRAKEHSMWHSGFKYDCKICGASFSKSTSHLTHIRLHHPSDNCCDLCGESFIGEYGLAMHKKKAHRDQGPNVKSESVCVLCGVQFRNIDALNRHIAAAENNTCNSELRPCLSCGENFPSEEALKEHSKEHSKDDNVQCDICNRTFAHEKSYAIHYQRVHLMMRVKGGSRKTAAADRAVCEVCGKKCISNATLVYHQRTHTGEKPYPCTECPKRFSVYQLLQIHLRTHTGERPFRCTLCPKAFKHKAALNRHNRVHTGAKPYTCAHCGKSFSQSNSMKTHVRTVHLKLPAPYRHRRKNE